MDLKNVKVPKMPVAGGGATSPLIKFGLVIGLGVYGIANSLYNVDGGNRAIVFNRILGVKDKVCLVLSLWTRMIFGNQIDLTLAFVE